MKSKLHIDICLGRNVAFSELQYAHYQRKTQIRPKTQPARRRGYS